MMNVGEVLVEDAPWRVASDSAKANREWLEVTFAGGVRGFLSG
jgi:hypothetical protein